MDFFNSLTLDLKFLVIAIAGCVLLALFSGNSRSEKRYMVLLALLSAVGVYRFTQTTIHDQNAIAEAESAALHPVKVQTKHVPLVSTSAK
jgi:hypothetical protein